MRIFRSKREAAPRPEKPWPYELVSDSYAIPTGYRWVLGTDCRLPLVCERCGASVVHSGVQVHDEWHNGDR